MVDRVLFRKCHEDAVLPEQGTEHAAGYDIRACLDTSVTLCPGGRELIPTGLQMELPVGMEAQVRPRSGLAIKHGITLLNSPGTIDADYRGEVKAIMINHGNDDFTVTSGMRIAQLVFQRVANPEIIETADVSDTARGSGGFGHTGTE